MLANNQRINENNAVNIIEKTETSLQYNRFPFAHEKGVFSLFFI